MIAVDTGSEFKVVYSHESDSFSKAVIIFGSKGIVPVSEKGTGSKSAVISLAAPQWFKLKEYILSFDQSNFVNGWYSICICCPSRMLTFKSAVGLACCWQHFVF